MYAPERLNSQPLHHGAREIPSRSTRHGILVVLAATIAMAMGFGGLGLIGVFMGPMEADLGWSRADTSFAYALSTLGMAVGGLFWGRLADRTDIRVLLAIGGTAMVASLLAMAMLQSLSVLYIAHAIYGGLGFSVLYAPLLSTSGDWFPQRRGLVTGLVTAGGALGQGVLPFFASILIAAFGWRWAFVGIGSTLLAALSIALPLLRWPHGTKASAIGSAGARETLRTETTTVALLAFAAFFCCICMGVPLVHMASFIGAVCGSPSIGVNSLLVAMVAGAVGRVCSGSIADSIGPLRAYAINASIQTCCVLAFPMIDGEMSFMALSAAFGFGFAGNMTCLALCVRQAVPASRFGGALGAVMMVGWIGMAAGGYAGGALFAASLSYTLSFVLAGIAGVLSLVVIAAVALRRLTPVPGPTAIPSVCSG